MRPLLTILLGCALAGFSRAAPTETDAPPAAAATPNEKMLLGYYTAIGGGDLAVVDTLLSADFRSDAALPGTQKSRADFLQYLTQLRAGFPDMKIEILEWVSQGDTTVCRYRFTGTHRAKFLTLRPTRKSATVGGIDEWKIRDGKLAELHANFDTLGMLVQLGLVPVIK